MNDQLFTFKEDTETANNLPVSASPWRILIVDDDSDVHNATLFALKDVVILGKPLSFLHAYSGREALNIVQEEEDIALILLDAVMETEHAGLEIIKTIREDLKRTQVRIILRTGQPGQVPELETIARYDINDYKTKSELTKTRLITTLYASLRTWQEIEKLESSRQGLEKIINASNQFVTTRGMEEFAEGVILQLAGLFKLEADGLLCTTARYPSHTPKSSSDKDTGPESSFVLAAAGRFRSLLNKDLHSIQDKAIQNALTKTFELKRNIIERDFFTVYLEEPSGQRYVIWIASQKSLKDMDLHLLEVFCSNIVLSAGNIELLNKLKMQAWEDPLLEIPNMHALLDIIKQVLLGSCCNDYNELILLDIDGFSQINDLLGHEYGDEILKALVIQLKRELDDGVYIARVSSDLMAVLGNETHFHQSILDHIRSMSIDSSTGPRTLSISLSRVSLEKRSENTDPSTILHNGFIALKKAKKAGMGQIVRYNSSLGTESRKSIQLLSNLKEALSKERLFLMFQPQAKISDGKVYSFETLIRWITPQGEFIPPDRFIPLAEQAGLIYPMGIQIFKMAFQSLNEIHEAGFPGMKMAVNVSALQLHHPDFMDDLDSIIREYNIDPENIELEITETVSALGLETVLKMMNQLKKRGFSLAVDDFGTGYSSLSSIEMWPLDRLKIDKIFVDKLEQEEKEGRIVDLVVPLGKRLSLQILAEGVETEEQLHHLKEMECNEIQGYFLAKPMILEDLLSWLKEGCGAKCWHT